VSNIIVSKVSVPQNDQLFLTIHMPSNLNLWKNQNLKEVPINNNNIFSHWSIRRFIINDGLYLLWNY